MLLLARRISRPVSFQFRSVQRFLSTSSRDVSSLRNIGILAHIDAGKTTVTERMLFYTGEVSSIGEVHDGDTVMDYLEQERERGITINSAATTFYWGEHRVNLIDTPGHVDFTVEVERAVRALDGAVALFDAVAGVQAQSETVWKQADRYRVPRIAFVNKMDREGADFDRVVGMIEKRFGVNALVCHQPFFQQGTFKGAVDVVNMTLNAWDQSKHSKEFHVTPIAEEGADVDEELLERCWQARENLAERLSEVDNEFADRFLQAMEKVEDQKDWLEHLPPQAFKESIRKATLTQEDSRCVAVLCGSALKNTGVQLLLNAVVDFLPSPLDAAKRGQGVAFHNMEKTWEDLEDSQHHDSDKNGQGDVSNQSIASFDINDSEMVALAFKVQHDPARGPLVFVRVYSGSMVAKQVYHNVTLQAQLESEKSDNSKGASKERVNMLLRAYANEFEAEQNLDAGDIGIIVGAKEIRTGDTLSSNPKRKPLRGVMIPKPVFTASLEVDTLSEEEKLLEALRILVRDDPSLTFVQDEETAQLLLSGMGELHLDIALNKLQRDFKVECSFSKVRVAYRETLSGQPTGRGQFVLGGGAEKVTNGPPSSPGAARVVIQISQHEDGLDAPLRFVSGGEDTSSRDHRKTTLSRNKAKKKKKHMVFNTPTGDGTWELKDEQEKGLKSGILDALQRGPLMGYPMQGLQVEIVEDECYAPLSATPELLRAAAAHAVKNALESKDAMPSLLEPKALIHISCPDGSIGTVIGDLTSARRGLVADVVAEPAQFDGAQSRSTIIATVPLEGILGYSTALRSMTAGEASFSINVDGYTLVSNDLLTKIMHQ